MTTTQPSADPSVWDDPDLRPTGEFIAFDNIGDTAAGTVVAIRAHRFAPGESAVPQILLTTDDGQEKTLTAGQVRLKAALAEQRPEAGDHLSVKLTDIEKRAGGKTLKFFDVTVTRGGARPTPNLTPEQKAALGITAPEPPVAAPAAPQQTVDPAAAAAALANLTPEQKAALGIAT